MQLQNLYIKSINRPVNPAVSATKFDKETIDIEIKEYVFTDEILNGLCRDVTDAFVFKMIQDIMVADIPVTGIGGFLHSFPYIY